MNNGLEDREGGDFVHRQVDAATAGSLIPSGAVSSVWSLAGAGAGQVATADEEADADAPAVAETAVAPSPVPPSAAPAAGPAAEQTGGTLAGLLDYAKAAGPFTVADLIRDTSWSASSARSLVHRAKSAGHLRVVGTAGRTQTLQLVAAAQPKPAQQKKKGAPPGAPYRPAGKRRHGGFNSFLAGAAGADAEPKPAARRTGPPAAEVLDGFRCALYDDGGLLLEIDGESVQLSRTRALRLIAYVDLVRGTGMYGTP